MRNTDVAGRAMIKGVLEQAPSPHLDNLEARSEDLRNSTALAVTRDLSITIILLSLAFLSLIDFGLGIDVIYTTLYDQYFIHNIPGNQSSGEVIASHFNSDENPSRSKCFTFTTIRDSQAKRSRQDPSTSQPPSAAAPGSFLGRLPLELKQHSFTHVFNDSGETDIRVALSPALDTLNYMGFEKLDTLKQIDGTIHDMAHDYLFDHFRFVLECDAQSLRLLLQALDKRIPRRDMPSVRRVATPKFSIGSFPKRDASAPMTETTTATQDQDQGLVWHCLRHGVLLVTLQSLKFMRNIGELEVRIFWDDFARRASLELVDVAFSEED
ncbi:hypothetical protein BCR34DRAFT_603281 [Clohesyomyces aquaticus]|uniref:Uncharacterized protein n=1 Tax=Clohesyomyces aquaticus TaxID=1231657 RepID=A0A1Y1ZF15_9PLEO|nr:hypothetical protein BCR34DRAFT_603281 [Clohesyomyces aquaticus]